MKYLVIFFTAILSITSLKAQDFKKYLTDEEAKCLKSCILYFNYNRVEIPDAMKFYNIIANKCLDIVITHIITALESDDLPYMSDRQKGRVSALTLITVCSPLFDSTSHLVQWRDEIMDSLAACSFQGSVTYNGSTYDDLNLLLSAILHESPHAVVLKIILPDLVQGFVKSLSPDIPMYRLINELSKDTKFQNFIHNKLPILEKKMQTQ